LADDFGTNVFAAQWGELSVIKIRKPDHGGDQRDAVRSNKVMLNPLCTPFVVQ